LTIGSEYLNRGIRSKTRIGIYWRETSLIVNLATLYGQVTVNIDIFKKGLPVWQVANILDRKGQSKRGDEGEAFTEILKFFRNK